MPTGRGSTAAIDSAFAERHVHAGRRLRGRQRSAGAVDARRRHRAARGGGQDSDRADRDGDRQCDRAHGAQFQCRGRIRVVNFPGGGGVRITDADMRGPSGARARRLRRQRRDLLLAAGGLRIDGDIAMAAADCRRARVSLRQPRAGAPMSGVADDRALCRRRRAACAGADPLRAGAGRLDRGQHRRAARRAFPDGRVQALRLPIDGRFGQGGSFAFGTGLRGGQLRLAAD